MTLFARRGRAPPSTRRWIFFLGTPLTMIAAISLLVAIRLVVLRGDDSITADISNYDHVKADVKADIGNGTCEYSEDVAGGEWIAPDRWKPRVSECEYEYYTDAEFGSCMALRYRRIAFFGDSLLLNVFAELTRRLEGAGHGTLEPRPANFYAPGGRQEFVYEGTPSSSSSALDGDDANATTGDGGDDDDRRRLVFWWTPSSFHANIHRYEKEFDTLDAAVFGMAAWSVAYGTVFAGGPTLSLSPHFHLLFVDS
jgi:hypothetical protein